MPRVIVGMSGGVDSSIAAYLLKEEGYEVEGLSFIMWEAGKGIDTSSCCSLEATNEVSKTARYIGIPHSSIDVRDDFMQKVVKPFMGAYLSGVTPNPCVLCNKFIKFPFLMKEAEKRGAEYISTGHYARVEPANSKEQKAESIKNVQHFLLKKGIDKKKDQSYVLYTLKQKELKRLLLPLGYYEKNEVRKMAKELRLPAAERSESQEICFIEGRNYLRFIEQLSPVVKNPGPIVDPDGKVIGRHKGIYGYTIGQRKGMGISSPEPLYVIDIDIMENTIYAGTREAARKKEFAVEELNWITPLIPHLVGENKEGLEFRASVKVRSTMKDQPAIILVRSGNKGQGVSNKGKADDPDEIVRVVFDEPQWAPAPGQSAVFYDNDIVIGGGVIKKLV